MSYSLVFTLFFILEKLVPILTNLTFENQEHNKTVFKWSIENYNESYERIDHFTVIYYYNVIGYATTVMTNGYLDSNNFLF